jgi:hypothetical protein
MRRSARASAVPRPARHVDPAIFTDYRVRRDEVQAEALRRLHDRLAAERGTTPAVTALPGPAEPHRARR